jgi:tetratricopeptide (TPR) repeat protein
MFRDDSELLLAYFRLFVESPDRASVADNLLSVLVKVRPKSREMWREIFSAKALSLKDEYSRAIESFNSIISKYGERQLGGTATAFIWRCIGVAHTLDGKINEAIGFFDKVTSKYRASDDIGVRMQVAQAMVNKGMALNMKGRVEDFDAEIAIYNDVIKLYEHHDDVRMLMPIAYAMLSKGLAYGYKKEPNKAIALYDDVIDKFGTRTELEFVELVACAMFNKGVETLNGDPSKAAEIFKAVERKYGKRSDAFSAKFVGRSVYGAMVSLHGEERNAFAKDMIDRHANSKSLYIQEAMVVALLCIDNKSDASDRFFELRHGMKTNLPDGESEERIEQMLTMLNSPEYPDLAQPSTEKPSIFFLLPANMKRPTLRRNIRKIKDINLDAFTKSSEHVWTITFKDGAEPDALFSLLVTLFRTSESSPSKTDLIWRGALGDWPLVPSLYRGLGSTPKTHVARIKEQHLKRYHIALRGLQIAHGLSSGQLSEEKDANAWAFAQHHHCHSPMLDWSLSPYVATYFAYSQPLSEHLMKIPEDKEDKNSKKRMRMLYALNTSALGACRSSNKLLCGNADGCPKKSVEPVVPEEVNNLRVVAQSGLFLKMDKADAIDDIIRKCRSTTSPFGILRIVLPEVFRPFVLRTLNNMNINARTLFPDIFGAGQYANMSLEIENYDRMAEILKKTADKTEESVSGRAVGFTKQVQ